LKILTTVACLLAAVPFHAVCFGQGYVPDPPALVDSAPAAEAFRGILPPRIDLSMQMPPPRLQSPSRTCVSWAVTYAAASDALRRADPGRKLVTLSPAFTYAMAGGTPNCQRGTSIARTLEVLRTVGALPLDEFAFDAYACTREPTRDEMSRAARWRIKSWSRVDAHDLGSVKGQLAYGRPVIFAMSVGPKFSAHRGDSVLSVLDAGAVLDGHTMVLVGYDDARQAFRLQNSHGRDWGDNGYAWIGYAAWQQAAYSGRAFVIE
jgi:hypothetical protein